MKTSEFIKRVEELGYEVENNGFDSTTLNIRTVNVLTATVKTDALNRVDTRCNTDIPNELFDLLVEYASTPVEERKDVDRYHLYNPVKNVYFHYNIGKNEYRWNAHRWVSYLHADSIQTQFTQEEIKNNKFRDIMELLEK